MNINDFIQKEISRRDFLKRMRNTAGIMGLSQLSTGLIGCLPVPSYPSLFSIQPGNSNADYILGEAQLSFLQTTLEAYQNIPWKFVFAHHLFGGNDTCEDFAPQYGRGNANGAYQYDQLYIQELMEEYGVQAFFYGHDHVFSVSEASLAPNKKVSYICSGNAGSSCPWHVSLEGCYEPYDGFFHLGGHVRVDVSPQNVTVSYIRASLDDNNGTLLSSYQL